MSKEMEYEERVMLDYSQYFNIFSFFKEKYGTNTLLEQTNYYFDDKHYSLKQRHIVLRIRVVKDIKCELTCKIKGDNGDTEINIPLSYNKSLNLINNFVLDDNDIKIELEKRGLETNAFVLMGSLKTKRLECKEDDCLIVIDKNEYADVLDYNLEIESTSMQKSQSKILELCKKFNLEYKKDYTSKSSRLFNKLYK